MSHIRFFESFHFHLKLLNYRAPLSFFLRWIRDGNDDRRKKMSVYLFYWVRGISILQAFFSCSSLFSRTCGLEDIFAMIMFPPSCVQCRGSSSVINVLCLWRNSSVSLVSMMIIVNQTQNMRADLSDIYSSRLFIIASISMILRKSMTSFAIDPLSLW